MAVIRSVIRGVGAYLPKRVLTNAELSRMVDTTDEWITERTGIKQRHVAADDEKTSDLGIAAARLQTTGVGDREPLAEDIDPATGRMRADSFARYTLANAPEMPPLRVLLVEEGEPTGPFGAKAVGEIATVPVAPAIVNAVNHALGTRLTDLPLTPERILAAL